MTFPPDELPSIADLEASLCRQSLADFVRLAWANSPRIGTLGPLVWNWHLDAICVHLEALARGDIRNLLVNVPPGATKTELISIFFLPWVWTWRPGWRAIFASKVDPLAIDASVKCREVIESEWYQDTFVRGAWALRDDKNAKNDFANTVGGSRFATSVGGTAIGRHAHCIVGDDLQDDKQTLGEWRATLDYWSGTLSSRAVDPATVSKVCVQQRLGKGDLSEALIASGLFVHLCLPMRFGRGPANTNVTRYPDGRELWRDPRTKYDELLNPRRLPEEQAQQTYVTEKMTYGLGVGPVKYRAQYDQNPANAEGGEIKTSYWRFYRDKRYESTHRPAGCVPAETHPAVALPAQVARIISADTAVKENQTADWSVVGAIANARADVFLTDLDRARVAMPGLIKMFKLACARYPDARQKYVEDKSSGSQLIQLLKVGGEVDGYKFDATPGIVPVDPGKISKVERTRIHLLPRAEAGQVYLPEGAPWLDAFVEEASEFPFGDHDDQLDMLAQACAKLGSSGLERARALGTW